MTRSKRFELLEQRDINKETFVEPWAEAGLIVTDSPYDPAPSLTLENGVVVEMDGKRREDFDALDVFIATHGLNLAVAAEAMATPSEQIARMLADINVPRAEVARLAEGCTPAKLCEIMRHLNVLEMMMGMTKMRVRRTPANQAHVTNFREHPALLAADAAEAALRGFAEVETTVRVARNAPFNALAILVGSQTGRGGVLTQCSVEESLGLRLAMKGLTTYAETLSVYGTERSFVDGDDTPWSKGFLASAYASRGVKIRFTSGTGSEALMGHAEQKSMLYLEARCLLIVRGAGSQGVQNGSISCIALPEALPGGVRAVLAENLIAAMLGLEVPFEGAGVFNLKGEIAHMREVVAAIESAAPQVAGRVTFDDVPLPLPDGADDSQLVSLMGTVPSRSLADGIASTIDHFRQALATGRGGLS